LAQAARRLSGLETAVRVELITLPPVKVLPEETIRLALENRVDLMNRRGFVMDARRRFEVAADRLEATLDLVAEGEVKTPPVSENSQPFDFRAKQSEFRVGVTLTTPLDRRAQRNDFRAAQISYQRARRNYMTAEDQVKLDVRQQLRHVHAQGAVFEIQRRMLRVAARELEQAVEAGEQTVENGNTGGLQGMTIPRALDNMLDAQDALIDTWVDYETARLCLFRDMGTMQIDESGIWGEAQTVERRK